MDPEATLLEAIGHLAAGRNGEAHDCVEAYRYWRKRGGFQPTVGGDKVADQIEKYARPGRIDTTVPLSAR